MGVLSEIKAVRRDMRVTQRYLARALGISEKHMSNILSDKSNTTTRRLDEIASLLRHEWRLVPIPDDTLAAIRDAYAEAEIMYDNPDDRRAMFLYGMRYVMGLLDMPEGKVP